MVFLQAWAITALAASASALSIAFSKPAPIPLVIWHGLGDSFEADGMKSVAKLAERANPGTFVYNVRLADDGAGDRQASFTGNATEELRKVCDTLSTHPKFVNAAGINAVGFSQGGIFLRAYVERCNNPPVKNLVTFGSPHNGIAKFFPCASGDWLCNIASGLLSLGVWSSLVQGALIPGQYYRPTDDFENYLEHSNFLADVNNERERKNEQYAKNIESLDNFVMYAFANDTTLIPKQTAWFTEVNSTTNRTTPLRERQLYKEDWLGLRKLDEKGGLTFETTPGRHMQLSDVVMTKVFKKYFGPSSVSQMAQDQIVQDLLGIKVHEDM